MAQSTQIQDEDTSDYLTRTNNRLGTMSRATMALLNSFLNDDSDSYAVAKGKVKDVSASARASHPTAKIDFMLGEPEFLIAAIKAVDESQHSFMTEAKKKLVTDILKQSV